MAQAAVVGLGRALEQEGGVADQMPDVSWRRAHDELVKLAKRRAGLEFEEGRWLLRALRAGVHVRLGMGSFHEYAERLFGYGARVTQDKLRVAEALEGLPETARELERGNVSVSAVRELTRVAVPATEREWLEAARHKTVREVEQLVAGHRPGSRPDDAADAGAKRHVIRLELSGEALATFREAMAKVRRDAGESLDDDAAMLLLCRQALGGPRDAGRSSYQVALTVCEHCRRGKQHGRGELVEVAPETVEMAACDGQHVGHVDAHVGATASRASQTVPPGVRRAVLRRDGGRCRVPGCRHATFVDVHHLTLRAEGGSNTLENLIVLCAAHHAALHRGTLLCDGTPSRGLTFRHADGTPYGGAPHAGGTELRAKAQRALTLMGYREGETRRALGRLPASNDLTLEQIVRLTLRELSSSTALCGS